MGSSIQSTPPPDYATRHLFHPFRPLAFSFYFSVTLVIKPTLNSFLLRLSLKGSHRRGGGRRVGCRLLRLSLSPFSRSLLFRFSAVLSFSPHRYLRFFSVFCSRFFRFFHPTLPTSLPFSPASLSSAARFARPSSIPRSFYHPLILESPFGTRVRFRY